MKLKMYIEVEVSKTVAETIKRAGYTILPDGTGMKMIVSNAPIVPKRKVKITYLDSTTPEEVTK